MPTQIHNEQKLLNLSIPIFIDILLHFITVLINTYMVSLVSTKLLAAMGVGNQILDLCITIFNFIAVGCSVVITQYRGAGKNDLSLKTINVAIFFNLLLGFIICAGVILFGSVALQLLNTTADVFKFALDYLQIIGILLIFECLTIVFAAILRVYGKAKQAMIATLIANIITIIGNYLSLYIFDFGLNGVAISTVVGRLVCIFISFYLINNVLKIKINKDILFDKDRFKVLGKILHIGLPAVGENIAWVLQMLIISSFINLLGSTVFAAQTLYFQLSLFIMSFGIALSIANEIITGHLVGAKAFDKAYKQAFNALKIGFILTILVVILFYLFRNQILAISTKDEGLKEILLPIFALSLFLEPGRTLNIVMVNALRASGDARFPLYTAISFMFGISIPIAYFCGIYLEMGLLGIWIGFFADEWIRGLTNTYRWKSRKWESKRIEID